MLIRLHYMMIFHYLAVLQHAVVLKSAIISNGIVIGKTRGYYDEESKEMKSVYCLIYNWTLSNPIDYYIVFKSI